jgi:hypothetical protein
MLDGSDDVALRSEVSGKSAVHKTDEKITVAVSSKLEPRRTSAHIR